jgi:hypothetical protein
MGPDWNLESPEYKAGELSTALQCLVLVQW